jgi:endonuclease/exonuclease/phosphatase family metal-dependent hydrolase
VIRLPFVLLLLLLPGTLPGEGESFRVATWNVQNFLVQNRFEEGKFLYKYPMPESRKKRIREQILAESPDILFIQELGGPGYLKELQLDLKADGLDYPFRHYAGHPEARTGLSVLSKTPPGKLVFHDAVPNGMEEPNNSLMRRGIQEVGFQVNGTGYRVFHVHLKSRYSEDPDDPDSRKVRAGEIRALASFLEAHRRANPQDVLFVAGDFNTPFDDPLLDPLRGAFIAVPATDAKGNPDTYFHHSGRSEVLDGFWMSGNPPVGALMEATIVPLPGTCPSDHRMVLMRLPEQAHQPQH